VLAGRHGCTPDDVEAIFKKVSPGQLLKKQRKNKAKDSGEKGLADDTAVSGTFALVNGHPIAKDFINLLQTNAKWNNLHTLYVNHMGTEMLRGGELRSCKSKLAESLIAHKAFRKPLLPLPPFL
jgi:hypothetical protein